MPDTAKPWWQSKLIWLGAIEVVRGLLSFVQPDFVLSGDDANVLIGAAIIVLRFVTRGPIVLA